ncbi:MAG: hypothetical protein V3U75_04115 [Methylococcaceae bacterium]
MAWLKRKIQEAELHELAFCVGVIFAIPGLITWTILMWHLMLE